MFYDVYMEEYTGGAEILNKQYDFNRQNSGETKARTVALDGLARVA